ncbi:hypothetical protein [Thalassospira sp. UBA1131]|uniref:hypothetical protein n=1 Tax=Thalassospira sp. UBA1131 TaxID=1947672 RepID=UPI0025DB05F7|nr:hypothetical protein [Thalassospira sp. UBA1131]
MSVFTLNESSFFGRASQNTLSIFLNFNENSHGKMESEVEHKVRHILGIQTPERLNTHIKRDDWDDVIRDYSDQVIALDTSKKQYDLFILYLSGFFHELRHAHDLMATCYGQDILFTLANSYQNSAAILNELKDWQVKTGQPIPVPLPSTDNWAGLSQDARTVCIRYKERISEIQKYQTPLDRPASLSITDLLETSAVNAQIEFIHDILGREAAEHCYALIAKSPAAKKYLKCRTSVVDHLSADGITGIETKAINYIIWASLMAMKPNKGNMSLSIHPCIIFQGIVECLSRKSGYVGIEETSTAIKTFCNEWGLILPMEMAKYYSSISEKRLASIPKDSNSLLAKSFEGLRDSFQLMQNIIEELPDLYFNLNHYPWAIRDGYLPSVLVRTRSSSSNHDYLTSGIRTLNHDDWILLDVLGSTMHILTYGFGSLDDNDYEQTIISAIQNSRDHKFFFHDSFF